MHALTTTALALTGLGLVARTAPAPDIVGEPAPAIEATAWLNQLGQPLNNETLKGRPILIEMWATW